MKYLVVLALLFPVISYAQRDVKIDDRYVLKLDTIQWKIVKGSKGYKHTEFPNLFFSITKTPPSPAQKGMSAPSMTSQEFLNNAMNTLKKSGYEGLITSELKSYGNFSYYIFSYMEELNTVKSLGMLAVNDNDP